MNVASRHKTGSEATSLAERYPEGNTAAIDADRPDR